MLNIILLGLTSLLTDFSSEMIVPILPFFIKALGGSGLAIGLIFGVGDAVAAVLKVVSGRWADKTHRYKLFVFIGYLFSAITKFFYPFAQSWQSVGVIRPIERLGKGFRDAPRDAIVSESLDHKERGRGFGIQRAMDSVGALLGSIIVLVLFVYLHKDFKSIFWISALIGTLAIVPILFVKVPNNLSGDDRRIKPSKLTNQIKKFILVATLFSLANFSVVFFILSARLSFADMPESRSLAITLLLYIVFNIFDALFSAPAGALSDRIGRKKVILAGFLMFAVVCFGFMFIHITETADSVSFFILLGLFALYGVFKALIDASQRAHVADLSSPEIRGTALGTLETFTGLAAIPAGFMAGVLWDINGSYPFIFGLVIALVASVCFIILDKKQ